jgi:hypothetical protein
VEYIGNQCLAFISARLSHQYADRFQQRIQSIAFGALGDWQVFAYHGEAARTAQAEQRATGNIHPETLQRFGDTRE